MTTSLRTTVLVLGAGELGLSILQALASHPLRPKTSVLLRPSSKSAPDLPPNITPVYCDIHSSDLHTYLEGYDIVISATGFSSPSLTQIHLAEAAVKAGVGRFVPWQFGLDYDLVGKGSGMELFDEQLEVRRLLRAQSVVKWTIISTGLFTSYLFEPSFGVIDSKSGQFTALGSYDNAITITSPPDIGVLTADILLSDPDRDSGPAYIAGDTITYGQVYDLLASQGRQLSKNIKTVEELEREVGLAADGGVDDKFGKYRLVFAKGKGTSWEMSKTWNAERGVRVESLEEWMSENLPRSVQG